MHTHKFLWCRLPVDPVHASRVVPARVAVALVDVDLAVGARRARFAQALVPVDQILALAAVLAGVGLALVDLVLAQ